VINVTKNNVKRGFTLIELVVAMAIFFIIIAIAFASISRFYLLRTFYEQQISLQQNFLYAMDKLSDDLRQATVGIQGMIVTPGDNSMAETLQFTDSSGNLVEYRLDTKDGGKTYAIYKDTQPVTEEMHQLVKLYFVREGGKVIAIIVGRATYMGTTNTVSFTSFVSSRNYTP